MDFPWGRGGKASFQEPPVCLLEHTVLGSAQKQVCAQSCLTLLWPHGWQPARLLQARILEWAAIPYSRGSSWPRNQTWVSCIPCNGGLYHFTTVARGQTLLTPDLEKSCICKLLPLCDWFITSEEPTSWLSFLFLSWLLPHIHGSPSSG